MERQSLSGYRPWGCKVPDMAERLTLQISQTRYRLYPTTLHVKVTYLKQDSQRLNCLITVSKDSVRNTIEVLLSIVITSIATIVTTNTTS